MTSLLDHVDAPTSVSPAQWLRETTAAVRISFTWMGVRKTLTPEQKNQAAESFGAEGDFLSARKKLLDTRHVAFKDVTAIRGKVLAFWRSLTLPYPEPSIRLIRQHQIDHFNQQMLEHRAELDAAVLRLNDHYFELKAAAQAAGRFVQRQRLPGLSPRFVCRGLGFPQRRATRLFVSTQSCHLRAREGPCGRAL